MKSITLLQKLLANLSPSRRSMVVLVSRDPTGEWRELIDHKLFDRKLPAAASTGRAGLAAMFHGAVETDVDAVAKALESVATGGGPWQGNVRLTSTNEPTECISLYVVQVPPREEMSLCAIIASLPNHNGSRDSSIERGSESRDTALLAASIGIIEYDAGQRSILLDTAAAIHHGLAPSLAEPLQLDTWLGLLKREDQLTTYALLNDGVPPGKTERITVRLPSIDPKKHRVLELAFRARPSDQRLIGASRNVTRERSLEELRRQKLAAERASQAKSEFMSQVSHELRTPLNAVLGFAQLMELDQLNPLPVAHRERLDVVQHSGRRLLGLIDQLLQIGRIEQGQKKLAAKSVNVRALVGHCVDALQVAASDRLINIEIDIEQPQTASVRADPDALEQVLTNLLSNAIKYNRDEGRVRIRFRATDEGEITVDDTGKGLTDSQLGQLFEPFNRLAASKSTVQGTGLGLVITRQLVQAMGGKLDVWSQVGKGSRFSVRLPLGRRTRHPASETMPLDPPSQWDTGMQYRVLYVEDDEVNVVLMEQVFATQPDWKLLTASTGAEGLSTAIRQAPQIVLLDMNLPDMSGFDVFEHLKADRRTRDIPVVAVSADALPDQIDRAEALGFDDYWTKPLNLPVTVSKLKKLLQH